MPLMTIRTNSSLDDQAVRSLLSTCSAKTAEILGKPETYVMTLFETVQGMSMAGSAEPSCLVEIRSVGSLSGEQTRALSAAFCPLLSQHLGVEENRVYLNFTAFPDAMWGFRGSTFG